MLVNLVPISFQHKTTNKSVQNQRVTNCLKKSNKSKGMLISTIHR